MGLIKKRKGSGEIKGTYSSLVEKYLKDQGTGSVKMDNDSGKVISYGIVSRDLEYTKLLQKYVTLSKWRNRFKEFHKWAFFWAIVGSCAVFEYYIIRLTVAGFNKLLCAEQFSGDLVVSLVGALASLVTVIISIPIIIAKYLFNDKEDDNITDVIKGTQVHDSKEIELLKEHFKKNDLWNNLESALERLDK